MSNSSELLGLSIGLGGSQVANDTARYTDRYKLIHVLADAVFDEYTDSKMAGSILGITIKQGTTIGGDITSFKLTSGTVIAYK